MNLSNKSTEELKNTLKALQIIAYSLLGVIILLLSFTTYALLFQENNKSSLALLVVGLSCSAILPLQFSSMNKIKKEIKSRGK